MVFSRCGMRCDLCLVYRPNVEKEDRRKEVCEVYKKIFDWFDEDPQNVICDGCSCDKENPVLLDPECNARKCVLSKKIEHCGYCENFPCDIYPAEPDPEVIRQKIEVEKKWTWEDEELMKAYRCKHYMEEFRANHLNNSDAE